MDSPPRESPIHFFMAIPTFLLLYHEQMDGQLDSSLTKMVELVGKEVVDLSNPGGDKGKWTMIYDEGCAYPRHICGHNTMCTLNGMIHVCRDMALANARSVLRYSRSSFDPFHNLIHDGVEEYDTL